MTWTIADTAGLLLVAMAIASTWCFVRTRTVASRCKNEEQA